MSDKDAGDKYYRGRNFAQAIDHYQKAWEMDSTNMAIQSNMAAAWLEQGEYDKCIECCETAIETGRTHGAEFKTLAKVLARQGNAYLQKGCYTEALQCYGKSLTEYRAPDVVEKVKQTERIKKEAEEKAYRDPVLGEEAREEGTALFKQGKYPEAIGKYTEAIKRNDEDVKAYGNRSACYMKLLSYGEALRDCEKALSLDPTFVKAYLRKASIEMARCQYTTALRLCDDADAVDKERRFSRDTEDQRLRVRAAMRESQKGKSKEEILAEASKDPEISRLLADPALRKTLAEMETNPGAAMQAMKDPELARKIMRLHDAGILQFQTSQ